MNTALRLVSSERPVDRAFQVGDTLVAFAGYNCTYAQWARVVKVTAKSVSIQLLQASNFCDLEVVDGDSQLDTRSEWSMPGEVDASEKVRRAAIRANNEPNPQAQTGSKSDALYWHIWDGAAVSINTYD